MRVVRLCALALLALHLAAGAAWLARGIGDVPHYPDTHERSSTPIVPPGYLTLASEGATDPRRGLLYPLWLRAVHAAAGGDARSWTEGSVPERGDRLPEEAIDCHAPAWQTLVQLAQLALFALALAYASGVVRRLAPALPAAGVAVVAAAVFLDPFLLHAQLALMPDGPCSAALVLALAAWLDWTVAGRRRALALLALAALAAAGLRLEKVWVLAAGFGGCALPLALLGARAAPRVPRRRLAIGLAAVAPAVLPAVVGARLNEGHDRWSIRELVVHARVVYPHLEDVHSELSDATRRAVPIEAARAYDESIARARSVIELLSGGDPRLRAVWTSEMASAALRARAPALAADAALDALRNLVPTLSLHARFLVWRARGSEVAAIEERAFEPLVLWILFSWHDPEVAIVVWGAAGVALVAGLALAALRAPRIRPPAAVALPALCLVGANACAFALTQDLFELRYVYPSHLGLVAAAASGLVSFARSSAPSAAQAARRSAG